MASFRAWQVAVVASLLLVQTSLSAEGELDRCSFEAEAGGGSLVQVLSFEQEHARRPVVSFEAGTAKAGKPGHDDLESFDKQAEAVTSSASMKSLKHQQEMQTLEQAYMQNLTTQEKEIEALQAKCSALRPVIAKVLHQNEVVLNRTNATTRMSQVVRSWFADMRPKLQTTLELVSQTRTFLMDKSASALDILRADAQKAPTAEEVSRLGAALRLEPAELQVKPADLTLAPFLRHPGSPARMGLLQFGASESEGRPHSAVLAAHVDPDHQPNSTTGELTAEQLTDSLHQRLQELMEVHERAKKILRGIFLKQYKEGQANYTALLETGAALNQSLEEAEQNGASLLKAEKHANRTLETLKEGLNAVSIFAERVREDIEVYNSTLLLQRHPVSTLQVSALVRQVDVPDLGSLPDMEDIMDAESDASKKLNQTLSEWQARVKAAKEAAEEELEAIQAGYDAQLQDAEAANRKAEGKNSEVKRSIRLVEDQIRQVKTAISEQEAQLGGAIDLVQKLEEKCSAAVGFIDLTLDQTDKQPVPSEEPPVQLVQPWRSARAAASAAPVNGRSLARLQAGPVGWGAREALLQAKSRSVPSMLVQRGPGLHLFDDDTDVTQIEQLGDRVTQMAEEQQKAKAAAEVRFQQRKEALEKYLQDLLRVNSELSANLSSTTDTLDKLHMAKEYLGAKIENVSVTLGDIRGFMLGSSQSIADTMAQLADGDRPVESPSADSVALLDTWENEGSMNFIWSRFLLR